jgi:hypothetical protein
MNEKPYVNKNTGEACGGRCDHCNHLVNFIFYGWGTFCPKCAELVNPAKLRINKQNYLLFDYCQVCNRREKVMIQVNYGFCTDCLKMMGKKDRKTNTIQKEVTKNKMLRFNKKVNFKILTPEESKEKEKLLK